MNVDDFLKELVTNKALDSDDLNSIYDLYCSYERLHADHRPDDANHSIIHGLLSRHEISLDLIEKIVSNEDLSELDILLITNYCINNTSDAANDLLDCVIKNISPEAAHYCIINLITKLESVDNDAKYIEIISKLIAIHNPSAEAMAYIAKTTNNGLIKFILAWLNDKVLKNAEA